MGCNQSVHHHNCQARPRTARCVPASASNPGPSVESNEPPSYNDAVADGVTPSDFVDVKAPSKPLPVDCEAEYRELKELLATLRTDDQWFSGGKEIYEARQALFEWNEDNCSSENCDCLADEYRELKEMLEGVGKDRSWNGSGREAYEKRLELGKRFGRGCVCERGAGGSDGGEQEIWMERNGSVVVKNRREQAERQIKMGMRQSERQLAMGRRQMEEGMEMGRRQVEEGMASAKRAMERSGLKM